MDIVTIAGMFLVFDGGEEKKKKQDG